MKFRVIDLFSGAGGMTLGFVDGRFCGDFVPVLAVDNDGPSLETHAANFTGDVHCGNIELWLKGEGREWFMAGAESTCRQFGHFLDADATMNHIRAIADGRQPFSFMPWRVLCLGKWYDSVK